MRKQNNTQTKPAREAAIRAYILRLLARTAGITTLLAFAVAARATPLPWATPQNVFPWQAGKNVDGVDMSQAQVDKPASPGTLFASINWFMPNGNLNAGAALEHGPYWAGLIWWDFLGGHTLFQDTTNTWQTNSPLHLGLSYAEVIVGYGGSADTWWKIPVGNDRIGITEIQPDPHIPGWVTHINLFVRPVPDTGSSVVLLAFGFLALVLARLRYEP